MTEKAAKRRKSKAVEIQGPIEAQFLAGVRSALNPLAEVANRPCPECQEGISEGRWCPNCRGTGKVRA